MNILSCIEIDKTKCRNLKTQNFFFLKKCCNVVLTSLGYRASTQGPLKPSALLDFRLFPSFPRTQANNVCAYVCMFTLSKCVHIHICIYIHTNTQLRLWSPYQVLEMIFFCWLCIASYLVIMFALKLVLFLKYRNFFNNFFCFNSKSNRWTKTN